MSDAVAPTARARLSLTTHFQLAARNLLRNSRRSVLTLAAVVVAMGALTYLIVFTDAYLNSMKDNFVLVMNDHVQIYGPDFKESGLIHDYMRVPSVLAAHLDADPRVQAWTARIQASGLASVARATTAVAIVGVDPERERGVSRLGTFLAAGEWVDAADLRGVLLGADVAENL